MQCQRMHMFEPHENSLIICMQSEHIVQHLFTFSFLLACWGYEQKYEKCKRIGYILVGFHGDPASQFAEVLVTLRMVYGKPFIQQNQAKRRHKVISQASRLDWPTWTLIWTGDVRLCQIFTFMRLNGWYLSGWHIRIFFCNLAFFLAPLGHSSQIFHNWLKNWSSS